jgi:hypothetical protein
VRTIERKSVQRLSRMEVSAPSRSRDLARRVSFACREDHASKITRNILLARVICWRDRVVAGVYFLSST